MVAPLIPIVLIGIGATGGAGGLAFGAKGGRNLKRAKNRISVASALYEEKRSELEGHEAVTNESLKVLGGLQEDAFRSVVDRMAEFLRRNDKLVNESEKLLVDGMESTAGRVQIGSAVEQDALTWVRGVLGSVATGAGINAGLTTAVTSYAAASTGTAIASLSGAAATNATMAFFGGGSLAAGGGGMALGATALNFVTIGPALLVSGLMVAGQGQKALTRAAENEATVNVAIAEMDVTRATFDGIISRVAELSDLLTRLRDRAVVALNVLESEPFDPAVHADRFRHGLTLTMAVRDVASTPVVDGDGKLNETSATLTVRYRTLADEEDDV